jgi:SAM-dependent methyltransferase
MKIIQNDKTTSFRFNPDDAPHGFACNADDSPIFLWGAGEGGKKALEILKKKGRQITGFIDSDPRLAGTRIGRVPIHPPHMLPRLLKNEHIIVASVYWREISQQLLEMGYRYGSDYTCMTGEDAAFSYQIDNTPESYVEKAMYTLGHFDSVDSITGARILVVGTGLFPGLELALILAGARTVAGIDIIAFPDFPNITAVSDYYENYINLLIREVPFSQVNVETIKRVLEHLFIIDGGKVLLSREILNFNTCSAEDIQAENGSFDCVISHAVMEHLENPLKCLKEINRVLKPGGYTYHQIDLRDHRNHLKPYEFMYMSRQQWRAIQRPLDFAGGNPYRSKEYIQWFEMSGFKIDDYCPQLISQGSENSEMLCMERIHADYRCFSKSELEIQGCFIKAQKRP